VATQVEVHFIFDSSFFDEVLTNDGGIYEVASRLTYITSHASKNRRSQNKISPKSFDFIIAKHPKTDPDALKCALNRVEAIPGIEVDPDEVTRTVKYAVYYTLFWPFKSVVFTSAEKAATYAASDHLKGLQKVTIVSGPQAIELIDRWFRKCREERNSSC
jgi:hypothetical protein